ncbi:MAG TPA: DinB family protein [Jatrophihabitans sp.]|jgi:hypothetical protein|uniref:DinB family protein n=1 Tax=Jatrophihabitans sp. TaxID=1932789 RepID=UPI002E043CE4|nr:DinB family protein [Jatrophihabitans sp.]
MFTPGTYTEGEVLLGYLDQQLAALRASAFGLTEEQARATPCRSALSIGGLIKHATYVLRGRERRRADPGAMPDEAGFALFMGSFALADGETLAGALDAFDAARAAYLANVRATDPGAPLLEPPAPWDGVFTPTESVERFALVHHVEELARHAGHADIIREQLDGADAASLLMALEGRPGNDFVQPWRPAAT